MSLAEATETLGTPYADSAWTEHGGEAAAAVDMPISSVETSEAVMTSVSIFRVGMPVRRTIIYARANARGLRPLLKRQ